MSARLEENIRAEPSGSKPPPPRRSGNQTKSSRQQFSACGACRMRRVRCDLKDSTDSKTCSNCREHGFNCVDEFKGKAKTTGGKLLRRGRRIQQVEAVYGPAASSSQTVSSPQSVIPRLDPVFFQSRFYARFHIQRPLIDPEEFKARYTAFFNGDEGALGAAGQLIALLLVTWAASYGVDQFGKEEPRGGPENIQRRRERTNEMVRELLQLIDIHGLPRKPSWDGVRVLLLVMPLTEDVAEPLERLTMYETAINQVYTLCSIASPRSVNSGRGEHVDALVRARIYWYAFVHEGITTGLRGGRLHLADDDLAFFQAVQEGDLALAPSQLTLTYSSRWALAPLRLASACRQINSALTGPKARERQKIDEAKLKDAWESIQNCWEEFESLRQLGLLEILTVEEANKFVDGWKIFIFECHNVIREFLKQRLLAITGEADSAYIIDPEIKDSIYSTVYRLHSIAEAKCQDVVQHVVGLVHRHLGTSFFEYDASMVRDGCFFAGYMLATDEGTEEQCDICVRALSEMRWAFSKSEERVQTLKLIWETRRVSLEPRIADLRPPSSPPQPQTHLSTATLPPPYKVESDGNTWSEIDIQGTTLATPSPGEPSASHEERATRYGSSSISSGSSTFSSGSPYTPSMRPHTSHSHTHQLDRRDGLSQSHHGPLGLNQQTPAYYQLSPESSSSHERYYQYTENVTSSSAPQSEFGQGMSAPTTYVGSDGQLNILSPVRFMASMGPDFRQHPSYTTGYS